MVAKVAGGILFLGLVSTGGIAVAKPHWLGMDYMPDWKPLSQDTNYSTVKTTNYGDNKFGNKKGNYLVGIDNEKNQGWWEWSFRRLEKDKGSETSKPGSKFANAKNYGTDNDAINKICESAYKANSTDVTDTEQDGKFKKSDVWKYCSPGKPSTISENENTDRYDNNKIGADATNKATLISVKNSANDWFWKIRNEEFWSTNTNDNNLSGSKASGSTDNEKSIFKTEYETNKEQNRKDERRTIKDLCEEAYKQDTTSQSGNNNTDTKKFCILEASAS